MNGLKYLLLITNREYSEQYLDFFHGHGLTGILSYFANGTANNETLDCFGLEKTEKIVYSVMVGTECVDEIKHDLKTQMNITGAGNGIAVFLPVDGIGGEYAKKYLIGEKSIIKGENTMENNLSKLVLIITIADKGNNDTVMDAARSAGATGGTVVRSKGTGAEIAKFFGVSISEEKEMIYIVAKREKRDDIMHAIMEKAGKDSGAHGITFSIPVDSVCGIGGLDE